MMKKIVFMTVMLACISLAGCSEKKQNASSQPVSVEVQTMKSAYVTAGYDYVGTVKKPPERCLVSRCRAMWNV